MGAIEVPSTIELGGREVPVRLRRHARARNIVLRLDPPTGGVVVTLPPGARLAEGLALVRRQRRWVLDRLAAVPRPVPFADGAVLPLGGIEHRIRAVGGYRGTVSVGAGPEGPEIRVPGPPEHLARRLTDWLRAEAARAIRPRAAAKAEALGRQHGRITIRDTRSRWGSCAANGNLSFCWRLILAPEAVLDYVVAHEVAHLVHRNHGPDFWHLVGRLTDPPAAPLEPRAWLRQHGRDLLRYG